MTDLPHKPFPKIARLFREVIATEKIDGTNGVIYIDAATDIMHVGSRNRWLTEGHDNYGFLAWAKQNEECLRGLGPGVHYGEWWGRGIQRGYGLQERRFSLFNIARWGDDNARPACCHVVPVLTRGTDISFVAASAMDMLMGGSKAAPGFMQPEGVVVFHTAASKLFKYTFGGDGHKETLQS